MDRPEGKNGGTLSTVTTVGKTTANRETYSKRYACGNVWGLGVALLLNMAAVLGLFGIQSSINRNESLGLVSLSVTYASSTLISFVTPGILSVFGTKFSLVIGFACRLIYTICNYYPTWYTLIPGAVLSGFGSTITWASLHAHITRVAELIAPRFDKDRAYLVTKNTGLVYFFYYLAIVTGNLTSSIILFPYNTTNSALYSGDEGVSTNASCVNINSETVSEKHVYSLLSVYVALIIGSMLVSLCCLNQLPTENRFFSTEKKFQLFLKKPFLQLLGMLKNKKMLLIVPMIFAATLSETFAFGTFTQHFVSDCFDVYLVGFTLAVFSASSSAMCIMCGRFVKFIPRFFLLLFGAALAVGVIIFIEVWDRVPSYSFIFTFVVVWGISNGILTTLATSLAGILFPSDAEVAYSTYHMFSSLFYSVSYGTATKLNVSQIRLILAVIIVAVFCELIIEIFYLKAQKCFGMKASCAAKTSVEMPPAIASVSLFPVYESRSASPILLARSAEHQFQAMGVNLTDSFKEEDKDP